MLLKFIIRKLHSELVELANSLTSDVFECPLFTRRLRVAFRFQWAHGIKIDFQRRRPTVIDTHKEASWRNCHRSDRKFFPAPVWINQLNNSGLLLLCPWPDLRIRHKSCSAFAVSESKANSERRRDQLTQLANGTTFHLAAEHDKRSSCRARKMRLRSFNELCLRKVRSWKSTRLGYTKWTAAPGAAFGFFKSRDTVRAENLFKDIKIKD